MYEVHFGELCVKLALEPWYFFEGIVSADFVVDCTCFDGHATLISERKDCDDATSAAKETPRAQNMNHENSNFLK